jgi:hypothetical protein
MSGWERLATTALGLIVAAELAVIGVIAWWVIAFLRS